MDVLNCINKVEERWLARLYSHCKHLFEGVFLPSHDHLHHHRVWEYAKGILHGLDKAGQGIAPGLAEQLIIAAFFHDTGLTVTRDEKHGMASRRLCEDYLKKCCAPNAETPDYKALFQAIEHHDDKSFGAGTGTGSGLVPGLLDILTCSDDLDALGAIGIYRYAEIYFLRGIRARDLPGRVIQNLDARFQRLVHTYRDIPDLTVIHLDRYRLIHDFYMNMENRGSSGNLKRSRENEWIGLIARSLDKRINLMDPDRPLPRAAPETLSLLRQLHAEVAGFRPPPI